MTKTCSTCGEEKDMGAFSVNKNKGTIYARCKECTSAYNKSRYVKREKAQPLTQQQIEEITKDLLVMKVSAVSIKYGITYGRMNLWRRQGLFGEEGKRIRRKPRI